MQKIIPYLWFDKEAGKAAELYTSAFRSSRIQDITHMEGTPSGTVEIVSAELFGQEFVLMSAGPYFKFTPAVSFLVACPTPKQVDALWKRLAEGGQALMELGKYPFSERYGWVQDRYGLSWQLMFTGDGEQPQQITPTLMFTGKQSGKAEEAIRFYTSVFHNASVGDIVRYDHEATVKHAAFRIEGQAFAAMDSAGAHGFSFNEAISFVVNCDTQEQIDYYWDKLSADPQAEQCGWLKDRYGLSWQIVPTVLAQMNRDKDKQKVARVAQAFLKMKKFDLDALTRAYRGD